MINSRKIVDILPFPPPSILTENTEKKNIYIKLDLPNWYILLFNFCHKCHLLAIHQDLRWLVELKLIQLEQQKTQFPFIILSKYLKPILCRAIKGT